MDALARPRRSRRVLVLMPVPAPLVPLPAQPLAASSQLQQQWATVWPAIVNRCRIDARFRDALTSHSVGRRNFRRHTGNLSSNVAYIRISILYCLGLTVAPVVTNHHFHGWLPFLPPELEGAPAKMIMDKPASNRWQ